MQTTIAMKPMNRVNLVVERGKENQDLLPPFHIRSQCLIQVCLAWSSVVVNSTKTLPWVPCAVSGFGQVLKSDFAARLFGLRPKTCRRPTKLLVKREKKPLLPRVPKPINGKMDIFGIKLLLTDLLFRLVTFLYIYLYRYDIYFYISFLYYIL